MAYNTSMQIGFVSKRHYYRLGWVVIAIFFSVLSSCKPDNIQTGAKPLYFDLAGYFKADTARLTKRNHLVLKTVRHNEVIETKKVHIDNWGLELSLFIQSDINRPAWRNSYSAQVGSDGSAVYMAQTPDLKTREIAITRNKDHSVKWIMIFNGSKNHLYETSEVLVYYPDSLYIIKKTQHVRFLGDNSYFIKGTLN